MTVGIWTKLDLLKLSELEVDNARLQRTAADLMAYLVALRNALKNGTPAPRRPSGIEGGIEWDHEGI